MCIYVADVLATDKVMSKKRTAEDAWGAELIYEQQPLAVSYQCDRPDKVQKGTTLPASISIPTEMWGHVMQYVGKCSAEEYSIISQD